MALVSAESVRLANGRSERSQFLINQANTDLDELHAKVEESGRLFTESVRTVSNLIADRVPMFGVTGTKRMEPDVRNQLNDFIANTAQEQLYIRLTIDSFTSSRARLMTLLDSLEHRHHDLLARANVQWADHRDEGIQQVSTAEIIRAKLGLFLQPQEYDIALEHLLARDHDELSIMVEDDEKLRFAAVSILQLLTFSGI